jgi:hypothetical protein
MAAFPRHEPSAGYARSILMVAGGWVVPPVGRPPAARTIRGPPAIGNAKRGQARALHRGPRWWRSGEDHTSPRPRRGRRRKSPGSKTRGKPDRIDGRTAEGCHNPSVATMCDPSRVGRNNGFLVPGVFDPGVIASATPAASPTPVGRLPAARTIRGLPAMEEGMESAGRPAHSKGRMESAGRPAHSKTSRFCRTASVRTSWAFSRAPCRRRSSS